MLDVGRISVGKISVGRINAGKVKVRMVKTVSKLRLSSSVQIRFREVLLTIVP